MLKTAKIITVCFNFNVGKTAFIVLQDIDSGHKFQIGRTKWLKINGSDFAICFMHALLEFFDVDDVEELQYLKVRYLIQQSHIQLFYKNNVLNFEVTKRMCTNGGKHP